MADTIQDLHRNFEPAPDPKALTGHSDGLPHGVSKDIDYDPNPRNSLPLSQQQQSIMQHILNLYGGSASEEDMQVYAAKSIYDDPYSYCDTRYKIPGKWYGLPMVFSKLQTLAIEVVKTKPNEIVFKLRHEYTPKAVHNPKAMDSLVSLSLSDEGKVRYHKDMWNEKDYCHEGLGKVFKTLNGDHLTKITKPPEDCEAVCDEGRLLHQAIATRRRTLPQRYGPGELSLRAKNVF